MYRRQELERLRQYKQALVLESGLNRLALQAEVRNLCSATTRLTGALSPPRAVAPLLLLLPVLAGFWFVRGRPGSWLRRLVSLAKWAVPLYRLWRSFSNKYYGGKTP